MTGTDFNIRPATQADIPAILAIFDTARAFMRRSGNMTQWTGGYPSAETVAADIDAGVCHLITDGKGEIDAVFSLIFGNDPTYEKIYEGAWPDDAPYATIHRMASTGRRAGMLRRCVEYALALTDTIRLDTHADNSPMRRAAENLGFSRCGIIYLADGSPRVAYHLTYRQLI